MKKNSVWLSDAMLRYIVSSGKKYKVNKARLIVNPTIARTITTREGETRADASSYICYELPDDCKIRANEEGYPEPYEEKDL